jgi:acylphosphatase
MMKVAFEITIHGRVQGVGFRQAARGKARMLGLKGWVENQPEGSVIAMIQGDLTDCHAFINWCREGPGYSWVEKVEINEIGAGQVSSFVIRY